MFEHVTNTKPVAGAGRSGLFLLGSSLVQGGVVVAVLLVASMIKARVVDEPLVPVKLARAAPAAPTAPPPAPMAPQVERRRTTAAKPLASLIAPRTIPESLPEPSQPEEEPAPPEIPSDAVVGGVVGKVAAAAPAPPPPPKPVVKDEPAYAGAGFVRPRLEDQACLQAHLQLPRGLEGTSAAVTAKFAIAADGAPSLFTVQPADADARLAAAIWEAIRACRWIAGADPRGKATKIWVLMPFRFHAN